MYSIRNGMAQRKAKNERRKTAGRSALALARRAQPLSLFLFSSFLCLAGCQRIVPPPTRAPVNNAPLVVDEAMQIRDWDRSTNYYANGAAVAGGTGYLWQTHEAINPGHRRFVEVPVAVLNMASMPVGVFVNSPFDKQVARGETVPPTYTGQPPLPGQPPVQVQAAEESDVPPPPPAQPTAPVETSPLPATETTEPPAPPAPVTPITPAPVDPITPAPTPDPLAPETPPPAPPATEEPVAPVPPPTPPAPPVESVPQ